jgi:hypothetical protein
MWRYRLRFFQKNALVDPFISNRKGEIHEINAFGERSEHPGEFTIGVHSKPVVIPPLEVNGRVWMM